MGETFESDHDEEEFEDELPPAPRRRKGKDDVPDAPVENAGDLPLLVHADKGKANTVTYLKVTRLDGPRGVRGVKGKMDPGSTYEDVARRYGNGTYKIEGCNQRHKVLAREEGLEISIPGFDDEDSKQGSPQPQGMAPSFGLHGMKMVTDMATKNQELVSAQATANNENVRELAGKTMEMMTAFTTAQRETERAGHQAAQTQQQQFFASMLQMMQTAHAQQMQMITAISERSQQKDEGPGQLETFIAGLKLAMEMGGGESPEPWLMALKEGSGMIGHLANLATNAKVPGAPALPGAPTPARLPSGAPQAAQTAQTAQNPANQAPRRKARLPFKKSELRGLAALRASLRKRGIDFGDFLDQTSTFYSTAPDSELFSEDDGQVESDDAANEEHDSTGDEATE